jgi:hypothetical protein
MPRRHSKAAIPTPAEIIAPGIGKHRGSEILKHARHEADDRVKVLRNGGSDDYGGHRRHHFDGVCMENKSMPRAQDSGPLGGTAPLAAS